MNRTRTVLMVAGWCLNVFAVNGCADPYEEEFAKAVAASSIEAPKRQVIGREVSDPIRGCEARTPKSAAEVSASAPTVGLYPAGCVKKSVDQKDPTAVHVTFDSCTDAFG